MKTTPSLTSPMQVWCRRPPDENLDWSRAHLDPECGVFASRKGDPVEVTATTVYDHSFRSPRRIQWDWRVRLPSRPTPQREHLDVRICQWCLNAALLDGRVASPPAMTYLEYYAKFYPHLRRRASLWDVQAP